MEDRTFHPFPRQPKELRDVIWALAIRPDGPSAHFFTVFDCAKDAEWSVLSQYSIRHPYRRKCVLAAPARRTSDHHSQKEEQQQQQEQQFSWVQGNRSGYLIDSGLWTACRESRAAVERRFKVADWDIKREELLHRRGDWTFPDAPATVSFTSNGEWQCCLTHPRTDLFFLQPFNVETADWECLDSSVPIFSTVEKFSVGHVAIDYDPGWFGGCRLPAASHYVYQRRDAQIFDLDGHRPSLGREPVACRLPDSTEATCISGDVEPAPISGEWLQIHRSSRGRCGVGTGCHQGRLRFF